MNVVLVILFAVMTLDNRAFAEIVGSSSWGKAMLVHSLVLNEAVALRRASERSPGIKKDFSSKLWLENQYRQLQFLTQTALVLGQAFVVTPEVSDELIFYEKILDPPEKFQDKFVSFLGSADNPKKMGVLVSKYVSIDSVFLEQVSASYVRDFPGCKLDRDKMLRFKSLQKNLGERIELPTFTMTMIKTWHKEEIECILLKLLNIYGSPREIEKLSSLMDMISMVRPSLFKDETLAVFATVIYLGNGRYTDGLRLLHPLTSGREFFTSAYLSLQKIYSYEQLGSGRVALKGM